MPQTISRRAALRIAFRATLALGAAGAGAGYTVYGEPRWLSLEQVVARIPQLPAALDGLRIAQLTDLHVSEFVSPALVSEAAALAMRQRPDLVVLTGDFVSGVQRDPVARAYMRANGRPDVQSYVSDAARALSALGAPLGVFAVLGNHDHWGGYAPQLVSELGLAGVRVLANEHERIRARGESIWLAGVDDVWEHKADIRRALRGIEPGGLRLLLAHEPDYAEVAAHHGIHLQLSGHSHGGQVRLPWIGALRLPHLGRRYPIGLQRVGGSATQVYTSRGVGVTSPPVRFNCPPEVTLITLRSA